MSLQKPQPTPTDECPWALSFLGERCGVSVLSHEADGLRKKASAREPPVNQAHHFHRARDAPRSSSGQDTGLSSRQQGFNSPTGYFLEMRNWECGTRNREFRISNRGDVAQLEEAAVSEAVQCGFDSHHHHCGRAGAQRGLISLVSGFDSQVRNSNGKEPDNGSRNVRHERGFFLLVPVQEQHRVFIQWLALSTEITSDTA